MKLRLNLGVVDFAAIQLGAVTLLLVLGAASYAFMHFTGHDSVLGFLRLLDVGHELSFPTYFSTLNLLLSSLLLFVIHRAEKRTDGGGSNYWLFLAILFLFLSIDEAASIHENFGRVQEYLASRGTMPVMDTHRWLPFGLLFTLIVAVVLIPFVRRLPRDTALLFTAAAFVFVLGAVGFEWLGEWMLSTGFVETRFDPMYLARRLAEEGCEMYGIAIFNIALYREMLKRDVTVVINDRSADIRRA